jgi:hypothetical protein
MYNQVWWHGMAWHGRGLLLTKWSLLTQLHNITQVGFLSAAACLSGSRLLAAYRRCRCRYWQAQGLLLALSGCL